jgi:hypothetical protein
VKLRHCNGESNGHSLVNLGARRLIFYSVARGLRRLTFMQELKQNFKHCKQFRKLYLQTEKLKKKMLQAINQIPLSKDPGTRRWKQNDLLDLNSCTKL